MTEIKPADENATKLPVKNAFPPNYEEIVKVFPIVASRSNICFPYGGILYVKSAHVSISHDLMVHEMTHHRQQIAFGGSKKWWAEYLKNVTFRLDQEIEAYRNQYRAMTKADRMKHIRRLAGDLSGEMYGNLITFKQAKEVITA